MEKTTILFVFCIFCFTLCNSQETTLNQKITIVAENTTLKEALSILEKKLNFSATYSSNLLDLNKVVSLNFVDQPLLSVLQDLFTSNQYQFKMLNNKLLIYKKAKLFTISGYVTESGSEEHLPLVSVYIKGTDIGVVTNDYGFYSLKIPNRNCELVISYMGYNEMVKVLDLKADTKLNIALEPTVESLDEIIVTNEVAPKESSSTQMSKISLQPNQVEDIPTILGEKDVFKALQLLPGVQAGANGFAGLHVRGGGADQNLIILDGATVYNTNHLYGFFSIFNGDAIKSITMLKGGIPARFGGRLSSVTNIIMKDGNKQRLTGKFNVGIISSSLLLEGPLKKGKTSFLLSARRSYAELFFKPLQAKEDRQTGYFFHDINFKLHHVINASDKLFWSIYHGQDKFYSRFKGSNNNSNERLGWGNLTSTLRWNHQFTNKLFSNTSLIYSNYFFNTSYSNKSINSDYEFSVNSKINDYSLKTDFHYYPDNKHVLKFGIASTYHNFTPYTTKLSQNSSSKEEKNNLKSNESAIYVEDDFKLGKRLRLHTGLRFSHFNYKSLSYIRPEPRISIAYLGAKQITYKASYIKMNQYIHLLSNSGTGLSTDVWVSSSDRIPPQVNEQFAFGVTKEFNQRGYSLTAETYYKKMNSVIAYKQGNVAVNAQDLETGQQGDGQDNVTFGEGWAYGAEVLLRKRRGVLTGWIGYTLSWSERQFKDLNLGEKFNDKYDSRHNISLVATYKPTKKVTFSANWVYRTGINYTVSNLKILAPSKNEIFEIGAQNIDIPKTTNISHSINNLKGEATHHLDLGVQFHKQLKGTKERTWRVSLYNAYARKNPLYYSVDNNFYGQKVRSNLTRTSALILIPSINYTFKF